jgi:sterol desaturase/sphingolipid hydroxylase (fatty acid hydroxylase superfamily)
MENGIFEVYNAILRPVMVFFILLEAFLCLRHEWHEYKVRDSISNILISIISWILNLVFKGTVFVLLVEAQKFALFDLGKSIFIWVLLFLLSDLVHYFFHYLEHKSRILWATHSIHHSSEHYNFSVALRSPMTNTCYRFLYEVPLCLLGFDAAMVVLVHTIILSFAFFQHSELIGKLGWLEYFLNTPSHHRVHHASNEKYLDKNFGAVLIIWDKLFGTFQAEEEKPRYGLTKPISTVHPVKIFFHEWMALAADLRKTISWKERMGIVFRAPGWKRG